MSHCRVSEIKKLGKQRFAEYLVAECTLPATPLPSVLWASPTSFGFPVVLNLSAFSPPIAKTDKYLSGWQASLPNAMGRTVLVNSVLDSALIYIMSAMLPPPGVVEKLDKRRRAFLWSGEETASGAQCLIAWDRVQLPKDQGGLGVKNLQILNQCLLLKLLHRLHHPSDSSWANWGAGPGKSGHVGWCGPGRTL